LTKADKQNLMDRLIWADKFERFLMTKFGQDKRFGLDGCESLIPGMKTLIDTAADLGVESAVIGMPHRGRLNVLGNVIRKPLESIFIEFSKLAPQELQNDHLHSGDVKYHLGTSYDRITRSGKTLHLSLMSNPSHLEAVDPLVEGKTRAKQFYSNNEESKDKVLSLQLHGDAAFAGQGIVYETLQMGQLPSYATGGSIHLVVNNQIGFTTNPSQSRSTLYCTDLAKAFDLPIFHVNGDDPEAVIAVCQLAAEFRQQFKQGVVVDIVSYRRFGHNEIDEPKFTQPLMYAKIAQQPSSLELYKTKIISDNVMSKNEIEEIENRVESILQDAFKNAPASKTKKSNWLESKWEKFKGPEQLARIMDTGVPMEVLQRVGKSLTHLPNDFSVHPTIQRDIKKRISMFEGKEGIDWATGEALAFGTLLLENNHVRLSGQDVERGTFSHRHAVLHDQKTGSKFVPLNHLDPKQAKFTVTNSFLSEYGVLGFELGYSLENPNALIMWEAQFGDFANGAQIIIDQFLSSGEQKWYRQSGLVMLLPHGYDGQGPEHSSARLERFLQLTDSDPNVIPEMNPAKTKQIQESNLQVVNITTPANYYHVLRRQVHREFRKPLVVMSPKNLLRNPLAKSPLTDFDDEHTSTRFQRLIPETSEIVLSTDPKSIRKVIFCSGQVYYALLQEREVRKIKDIAIVRIEQIAPFPFDLVQEQVKLYPRAQLAWCQEEPMNQGAWYFVYHHFITSCKAIGINTVPKYVGRSVSASPAAGTATQHKLELGKFISEAMA
jgi:2-oxoglutarate dehydrogenase E1 component